VSEAAMPPLWLVGFISLPFVLAGLTTVILPLPRLVRYVEVGLVVGLQLVVLECVAQARLA